MASTASTASAAATTVSTTATTTTLKDRIAELNIQIAEFTKQKAVLEAELDLQEKVPKYIEEAIATLVLHLGKNKKWETRIRKALQEHLKSTPKCDQEVENAKRDIWIYTDFIKYKWNDKNVEYSVQLEDEMYNAPASPSDCDVRENCLIVYNSGKWDDLEEFDLMYIPLLVAYYNGDIERNCNLNLE